MHESGVSTPGSKAPPCICTKRCAHITTSLATRRPSRALRALLQTIAIFIALWMRDSISLRSGENLALSNLRRRHYRRPATAYPDSATSRQLASAIRRSEPPLVSPCLCDCSLLQQTLQQIMRYQHCLGRGLQVSDDRAHGSSGSPQSNVRPSTSTVCSPRAGAWRRRPAGVAEKPTGNATCWTLPSVGWSISRQKLTARKCGSSSRASMELTVAKGMSLSARKLSE